MKIPNLSGGMGKAGKLGRLIKPKIYVVFIIVIGFLNGLEALITTGDIQPMIFAVGKKIFGSDTVIKESIEVLRMKNVAPCVLEAGNFMCIGRVVKQVYLNMAFANLIGSIFILLFIIGFWFTVGRHMSPSGTSTGYLNLLAIVGIPIFLSIALFSILFIGEFVFPFSGLKALVVNWRVILPFTVI